ncbi:MAG TPA: insulinase family protein [Thermoanaerobaculia bacterium]|nr:insulinase family protein [Thermoanaerobaculia bacterium]
MLRIPAAALLALLAPLALAQRKSPAPKKAAESATTDVLTFPATENTLPNGLKVIVVPTGFPNIVSLQIPVQTGARNEVEPGKSGFAHFFEHMMFRGTREYPPEKYQSILTQVGARQNAYTTEDYTNYHTTFSREDLELMLRVEADRFQHLSYDEAAFKTESRAVLGEYNKNAANPIVKLDEVQHDAAFTTHTYKHTTMGFLKDIEDMPNQFGYSKDFFARWYRPEYTTIIVAGDVKSEEVLPLVEKYWGGWKAGSYKAAIPAEPPARGPVYAHVDWPSPTLPWVSVAFHCPAFSDTEKSFAALDTLFDLSFGETSDLYKRLVETEQKVDQLFADAGGAQDPSLATVYARVKKPEDTAYVRDQILAAFAGALAAPVDARRLADAKSNARYSFLRRLDNTETIAATLARFVRYQRSYETLNRLYRVYASLTPEDLQSAAKAYFTDANLVVTTLSKDSLPEALAKQPALATFAPSAAAASDVAFLVQKTTLPQLNVKLLFTVGSAHDPKGKEGLSALAAAMIAEAGSRDLRIDEINKALYPMAGTFNDQVDKEMTTFTGSIHRDNWKEFFDIALPQLLDPGFREEDFHRLVDSQRNALTEDLRNNNEEELGKERLQTNLFAGTPYGHPVLGTVAGLQSITLQDVKDFVRTAYTRAALTVGVAGDAPEELLARLRADLSRLPAGPALPPPQGVVARRPSGMNVEIIEKDTRSTAISLGSPIGVTRSSPDFAALWVARTWLGEHRSSVSHLYQRIREIRGMNYGDYAYIEAFPRGMFEFFPDPNIARRAQIFEIWIRPVVPVNAHMALRVAVAELDKMIQNGLSEEDFQKTRGYLMKNVYVMTATQNEQIGYALDSKWYGIGEFTETMRSRLAQLTRNDVNRAIQKHLTAGDLSVVVVTKDAKDLRDRLLADGFSPITYDGEKPKELLDEDKIIGARKLGLAPDRVRITPVEEVFAR